MTDSEQTGGEVNQGHSCPRHLASGYGPGRTIAMLLMCLLLAIAHVMPAQAQQGEWQEAIKISQSEHNPDSASIAVDPAGQVHVVWSEALEDGRPDTVFYTVFDGYTWSEPVDIIFNPGGYAEVPVLVADPSTGVLHLVCRGMTQILYSQAYAPTAGSPEAWRMPTAIGEPLAQLTVLDYPDLALDSQGHLHVAYTVTVDETSRALYSRSSDGGEIWSYPQEVFLSPHSDRMLSRARTAVDGLGGIHIVWTESDPETFPPLGIRYTHSFDDGLTWSYPMEIEGPYDLTGIITVGDREIHLVWSGTGSDRHKFHMWSADQGSSWSAVNMTLAGGGYQGWPSLALDGAGRVHLLQVGDIAGGELVHQVWNGARWSPPTILVSRPDGAPNHATNPDVAIGLGNEIHVVVSNMIQDPPGSEDWRYNIFYLHSLAAAPRLEPQPLRQPTAAPSPVRPEPSATPLTTARARPTLPPLDNPSKGAGTIDLTGVVLAAVASALVLVVGVAAVYFLRRR